MRPPVVETPDVKVPATPVGPRFFKAVTLYGLDFHTGAVPWLPPDGTPIPEGGWLVEHPHPGDVGSWDAAGYLSTSTVETDCTGFDWPARLLLVEPTGAVWTPHPDSFPHKRAAHAWRVTEELPSWMLFGPQGREVASLIEQADHLTSAQIEDLTAAWDAAYGAAREAAYGAAYGAARDAAWDAAQDAARNVTWFAAWVADRLAAWYSARDAVLGALVADVLDPDTLRLLVGPWERVMGRVIA